MRATKIPVCAITGAATIEIIRRLEHDTGPGSAVYSKEGCLKELSFSERANLFLLTDQKNAQNHSHMQLLFKRSG